MGELSDFLDDCTRPLARRTQENYAYYVGHWDRWCATHGIDPLAATTQHLEARVADLRESGQMPRAIISALSPVISTYRWLYREGLIDADPGARVRLPHRPKRSTRSWLDRETARAWIDAASTDPGPIGTMVLLWLLSGLRPAEPEQLRGRDLGEWDGHMTARIPLRKGGGADVLLLPEITAQHIRNRAIQPSTWLVPRPADQPIDRHVRRLWLVRFAARYKLAYVPPYSLRTTYITLALASGADPRHVAGSADHSVGMGAYYDRLHGALSHNPGPHLAEWIRGDGDADHGTA